MILYSDDKTRNLERNGRWIECIRYLYKKWYFEKENESLLLKLAVNIWYTLSFEGIEVSLIESEHDYACQRLLDAFHFFLTTFNNHETCEWIFGYMMIVRPDLFLITGLEYVTIEKEGLKFIDNARKKGNLFALLLYAKDHFSLYEVTKCCNEVKKYMNENFNETEIVDSYFIEVLSAV